jgi:hypothetical protein
MIEAILILPMVIAVFFGFVYRRYYEDKIRFHIQGNYSDIIKIDQSLLEGDFGKDDEVLRDYERKILNGQRIADVSFIIGILMMSLFIPIELGWFG